MTPERLAAIREAGAAWCTEELFEEVFRHIDAQEKALQAADNLVRQMTRDAIREVRRQALEDARGHCEACQGPCSD